MTDRPDLLRPFEPAQSQLQADGATLDALLTAIDECTSLIAAQNEAAEQATGRQQEALQSSLGAISDHAARIEATAMDEAARHEDLATAMREVSKAVAGLGKRLDTAGSAHFADMRADLDALRVAVEQNGRILETHDLQLRATVEILKRLAELLETLATAAVDTKALQEAHAGQTKSLDEFARGTSSLGGRFRRVEQALTRHGRDVRLLAIAIPLFIGGVIAAFIVAGIVFGWFADPAGASLPRLEGVAAPA